MGGGLKVGEVVEVGERCCGWDEEFGEVGDFERLPISVWVVRMEGISSI